MATTGGSMEQASTQVHRRVGGGPGAGSGPDLRPTGRGVLEGAFRLMTVLDEAGQAGLTSLAARTGLPKTTAYRLLRQLAELGAVERHADTYRMGPRMFRLGQGWEPCPGLRTAAREPVRRLVAATGAMVGVSTLGEGRTLMLDWAPGQDAALAPLLKVSSWPWFTAPGKAQAADRAGLVPEPLPGFWAREAAAIRKRGAAFDRGTVVAGVNWTAVAVLDGSGTAVGALCALTTVPNRLEPLADMAQRAGEAVTLRLRQQSRAPGRILIA
nr:helix-turn-helix domain-containing protein [Streptomyces sp. NBC_00899]